LNYLSPGLGFGGSCLPKDCHLINSDQAGNRFLFETAKTALSINERVLDELIDDATKRIGSLKGKKFAILGAAFKPDLDDTRGSRSVALGHKLIRRGAKVVFYEPLLPKGARIGEGQYEPERDVYAAMHNAQIIVIGTAHSAFRKLTPKRTTKPVIVYDYFGILNHAQWTKLGYQFA
jgi:UDPglucose 6-dehydrogenase